MLSENEKISVIVPAYNVSKFIVETVTSVLGQTYSNFELLIINDGAPDSDALESALAPYMDRIRYLRKENGGPASARNEGIRLASGKWVAFLDGDDIWDPHFLESQVISAERRGLDFIYCDMHCFGADIPPRTLFTTQNPSEGPVTVESLIAERCTVLTSTVLVRRETLLAVGLFDPSLIWAEDFHLWLRILLDGYAMGYQKLVLGHRRIHAQALTSDTAALVAGTLLVYDKIEHSPGFPQNLLPLLNHRRNFYTRELHELRFKKCLVRGDSHQARIHYEDIAEPRSGYLALLYVFSYVPWLACGAIFLRAWLSRFKSLIRVQNAASSRVLLMGYYGVGNLGDEMMLFCLRHWLAKQQTDITVVTEYPEEIRSRYGLPVVHNPVLLNGCWRGSLVRRKAVQFYLNLRAHDALVVGGGDLIRDDKGWGCFLFTVEKIALAWLMNRPVYLVNIGIGNPTKKISGKILKFFLRRCRSLIVRDRRSLAICVDAGAKARTRLAPDIVLTLPELIGMNLIDREKSPLTRNILLVCLRTSSDEFGRFALNDDRLARLMTQVQACAVAYNLEVVFLPFQCNPETNDDIINRRAAALLSGIAYSFVDWSVDYAALVELFSRARLVLAMRLHAAVLAASTGTQFIYMNYDQKVEEFGGEYSWAVAMNESDCDDANKLGAIFASAINAEPSASLTNAAAVWSSLQFFPSNLYAGT